MSKKLARGLTCALAQVAMLGFAMEATASSAVLTLGTTGTISSAPAWENGTGLVITNIDFDFTGIAQSSAAANIDSAAQTVKLVNATAYPATVALVRPSTCSIGTNPVANADVNFLNNGATVMTDSNISISAASNQTYALRFAASGNYGLYAGAVTCSSPGSLTYSY